MMQIYFSVCDVQLKSNEVWIVIHLNRHKTKTAVTKYEWVNRFNIRPKAWKRML